MFARHVTMKLKANSVLQLPRIIENDVLTVLRKQKGFRDEISFVSPERSLAVGISLWDTKDDAEAYNRAGYPEVLKALSGIVEGTPTVETFDVATSTLHKIASKAA
jgi:heme-degrading monooxygenase HmoA